MLSGGAVNTVVSRPAVGGGVRHLTGEAARGLRSHWLFLSVLAVGALLRVLIMVAYPPALFFDDSWAYLSTAFGHHLVSLPYLRPVATRF
jgi:hypothetical protein